MFPRRVLVLLLAVLLAAPMGAALVSQSSAAVNNPAPGTETLALIEAINAYRGTQGLAAIPVSPELTAVAVAHVRDLAAWFATDSNYTGTDCAPHGWSSHGNWTGGCYKFADSSTWPIMWNKPKEIANYPGQGFEILAETMGTPMTAATALKLWAADPPHNDVIVNQGIWKDMTWQAMGVWVEGDWASVWFGAQADPTPAGATTGAAPAQGNAAATQGNAAAAQGNTTTAQGNGATGQGNTTGAQGNGTTGQGNAAGAQSNSAAPAGGMAGTPVASGATPIASPVASPVGAPGAPNAGAGNESPNAISTAMSNGSGNGSGNASGNASDNASGNASGNMSGNGSGNGG